MSRRVAVVVLLLALVTGGLVLDRVIAVDDAPVDVATEVDLARDGGIPVASALGTLSSTWYCAGGSSDAEAFANHVVTILNPTAESVTVRITAFAGQVLVPEVDEAIADLDPDAEDAEGGDDEGDDGDEAGEGEAAPADSSPVAPVERMIDVAPDARARLALSELVDAPVASAMVEAPTGGVVVEHEVASIHGYDAKPCASSADDTWHFAWGTTVREARQLLVLFNPFPADAVVDGRFSTEDGVREPARFDGLVVPGRSTMAIDLGDDVTRRSQVSATLTTRTGRVVVDRVLRINAGDARRGLTVQLGVNDPQTTWVFPDGFWSEQVREQFVVYNPTDLVAEVAIDFLVDRPDENGIPEPIPLSVPPGTQTVVDVGADGRVPSGVAHTAVVRSSNETPIVVERVLASSTDSRNGITTTTGSPLLAEEWWFAAGEAGPTRDEWLIVANLDPVVVATVDVIALVGGQEVPVSELQGLEVQPSSRLAIRLAERIQRDDLSIAVRASDAVVVERGQYLVGADERGMSNAIGIPSPAVLRRPGDPLEVEVDADFGDLGPLDPAEDDDLPVAPDDVELPEPDETIVPGDPDAEAEIPTSTTETTVPDAAGDGGDGDAGEAPASTDTTSGGVPDTAPPETEPAADG